MTKRKSIKNPENLTKQKTLEYFYYLCWEMYKLIDDSKFKVAKYDNQKLFAEYRLPLSKADSLLLVI